MNQVVALLRLPPGQKNGGSKKEAQQTECIDPLPALVMKPALDSKYPDSGDDVFAQRNLLIMADCDDLDFVPPLD